MLKWIFVLSLLSLGACNNKGSNNSAPQPAPSPTAPNQTATTPLNTNCLNGTNNCNPALYNQYSQYGWYSFAFNPYDMGGLGQYSGYYRFCGCPRDHIPAYNGSIGLGCVQKSRLPRHYRRWGLHSRYRFVSWKTPATPSVPTGNQMINFRQTSSPNHSQNYSCYNQVVQSCFVSQPNSCTTGTVCVATANNSALGICTANLNR